SDIARREDVRDGALQIVVHLNVAARRASESGGWKIQALDVADPADREQHPLDVQAGKPVTELVRQAEQVAFFVDALNAADPLNHAHAARFKRLAHDFGN